MCFYIILLIAYSIVGSIKAHQADIDINRLQRVSNEHSHFSPYYNHGRRFIDLRQIKTTNDYDDYSGGLYNPRPPLHVLYPATPSFATNTLKIHQPRENPKLYYQSDNYLKEVSLKNVQHEVDAIFPGREVIRASEYEAPNLLLRRRKENWIYPGKDVRIQEKCIRCPPDRTLVSEIGSDVVFLQSPRPLVTCSGRRASKNVKFVHMYGPKFGSYLKQGSYVLVGRITLSDETLRLCKMEVHVILQSCPVPKYLSAHCDKPNKFCNFTCQDPRLDILGETSLVCGSNMKWENHLPVCRSRQWCNPPMPPEQGRISCKGNPANNGAGLAEGSRCRVRCPSEWRPSVRGVTVCRRGAWTHKLQCQPKNRSQRI